MEGRVPWSVMEETSFVSSTGSRLAGLLWRGDATRTIVLVHGLASNARTWIAVGDLLNQFGPQVIAYDQRSHGRSERVDNGFDFPTYSADLEAVVRDVTPEPPVTVGQSWGGNVVIDHAASYRTLATMGIDGGFIRLGARFGSWDACASQLAPPRFEGATRQAVEGYMRTAHPGWTDQAIQGALGNFEDQPGGLVLPYLRFDDHMQILRSLFEHDPLAILPTINTPTQVVLARPGLVTEDEVELLGFDKITVVDGDHDLHLQQPETIAKLIWEATPWDR